MKAQLPLFKARMRRGRSALTSPPTPPRCKRPVTAYVHYHSMGGELLAFEVQASAQWIDRARLTAMRTDNLCAHFVARKLDPRARLVVLPSQVECVLEIEHAA